MLLLKPFIVVDIPVFFQGVPRCLFEAIHQAFTLPGSIEAALGVFTDAFTYLHSRRSEVPETYLAYALLEKKKNMLLTSTNDIPG